MAKSPARCVAENVITLRKSKGLTQLQLSQFSRIPRSTITHIESGEGNPSLDNLCRLSDALQVSVNELLRQPYSPIHLVKSHDLQRVIKQKGGIEITKLLIDPLPGMEIDLIRIKPGKTMGGTPHLAHTKEFLYCTHGCIEVRLAGERHQVEQGSVLSFPGDQPHAYRNIDQRISTGLSVVVFASQLV